LGFTWGGGGGIADKDKKRWLTSYGKNGSKKKKKCKMKGEIDMSGGKTKKIQKKGQEPTR